MTRSPVTHLVARVRNPMMVWSPQKLLSTVSLGRTMRCRTLWNGSLFWNRAVPSIPSMGRANWWGIVPRGATVRSETPGRRRAATTGEQRNDLSQSSDIQWRHLPICAKAATKESLFEWSELGDLSSLHLLLWGSKSLSSVCENWLGLIWDCTLVTKQDSKRLHSCGDSRHWSNDYIMRCLNITC